MEQRQELQSYQRFSQGLQVLKSAVIHQQRTKIEMTELKYKKAVMARLNSKNQRQTEKPFSLWMTRNYIDIHDCSSFCDHLSHATTQSSSRMYLASSTTLTNQETNGL